MPNEPRYMSIKVTQHSSTVQPRACETQYLGPAGVRNHISAFLCSLCLSAPAWAKVDIGDTIVLAPALSISGEFNKASTASMHVSAAAVLAPASYSPEPYGMPQFFGSADLHLDVVKMPFEAIRYVTSAAVASSSSAALVVVSVASVASHAVHDFTGVIQRGIASWYGAELHNRRTASGERFNMNDLTAAHRTLPFGTKLCAHSPSTGKSVIVRINDRGPFAKDRIIDFSKAAAQALGILHAGSNVVSLLGFSDARCAG